MANAPPGEDPVWIYFVKTIEFPSSHKALTPEVIFRWKDMLSDMIHALQPFFDPNPKRASIDYEIYLEYKYIMRRLDEIYDIPSDDKWLELAYTYEKRLAKLLWKKMKDLGYVGQNSSYVASTYVDPDLPVNMDYEKISSHSSDDSEDEEND
ncbi:MAG: hypothetical protein ACP5L4_02040 [Thermoplasmata archaeon]